MAVLGGFYGQGKALTETQAQRVEGQETGLVTELAGLADHPGDLGG
ncbi:hypothetical protein [Corallincola luteus]|nr:hypothetical protein [Corallincola luteus]